MRKCCGERDNDRAPLIVKPMPRRDTVHATTYVIRHSASVGGKCGFNSRRGHSMEKQYKTLYRAMIYNCSNEAIVYNFHQYESEALHNGWNEQMAKNCGAACVLNLCGFSYKSCPEGWIIWKK